MFFLTSTLNVELVYFILTGLIQLLNQINTNELDSNMRYSMDKRQAEKVEFAEKSSGSQILLKSIEIENLDKWSDKLSYDDYV